MIIYNIVCKAGGKFLDRANGNPPWSGCPVQLWGGGPGINQQWRVVGFDNQDLANIANSWAYIITAEDWSFKLDAVQIFAGDDGCPIQVWQFPGGGTVGDDGIWMLVPNGQGYFFIRNKNSGKLLNADLPNVNKDGCKVQLWGQTGGDNELWSFVRRQ